MEEDVEDYVHLETGHQSEAEKGLLIFGARESFGEVCDAYKGGVLEPGIDECLKDGKYVEVSTPCLEENVFGRLWLGWAACGVLSLEPYRGMGKFQCEGGRGIGCRYQ